MNENGEFPTFEEYLNSQAGEKKTRHHLPPEEFYNISVYDLATITKHPEKEHFIKFQRTEKPGCNDRYRLVVVKKSDNTVKHWLAFSKEELKRLYSIIGDVLNEE